MSYKSREKKRRAKAAIAKGRDDQRSDHADRYYVTIVKRACCCNDPSCGGSLREGAEAVYRHTPREILCLICADRRGIKYRPSLKWEAARRRKRKRPSRSVGRNSTDEETQFARDLIDRMREA